jgi:hypothetical protein
MVEVQTILCGKSKMTGLKAKTLRRILKKAGLKTSGKKATLRARAKSAHLVRGGFGPYNGSFGSNEEAADVKTGGGYAAEGNNSTPGMESAGPVGASYMLTKGGRRHGLKTKSLKKILKKAGLKTTGKKAALTKRAKSAHLIRGGGIPSSGAAEQYAPLNASGIWGQV